MKTTDLNQNFEIEKIDLFRDNLLHSEARTLSEVCLMKLVTDHVL